MASFAWLLALITLISLLGGAKGQAFPACSRSDADSSTLERCLDTVAFAVRAVLNASDDFDQACENLDLGEASSEDLDIPFLRILVCGSFGGQGRFYGNTDDVITDLALARVALEVSGDDPNDPALRFICPGLELILYHNFLLPAATIYNLACGDIYIPDPPSTSFSVSASATFSQSSNSSTASATGSGISSFSPPPYPASPPSAYPTIFTSPPIYSLTGYTSTPCTTSSISTNVYRRQSNESDDPTFWIKVLNSAIFALDVIESNGDDERCDAGDYWINVWNSMGFFGDYVNALICASAADNAVFPPRTTVQARASLIISLDGIILALHDPKNLARQIACDNLSYAVLSQAKLDAASIINFVCYSTGQSNSTTGPTTSPSSSTTTSTTLSSSTSGSGSSTTPSSTSSTTTTLSSSTTTSLSSSTTTTSSSSTTSTSTSGSSTTSSTSTSTTSTSSSTTSPTSNSVTSSSTSSVTSSSSSSTATTSFSSSTTTSSTSTTSSSSSSVTTSSNSTTSTSSSNSSSSLCSYIYDYGGYRYSCPTTTLDTSFSTTTTLRAH